MEIKLIGIDQNAPNTIEINYNLISFWGLKRLLRKLDGVKITWSMSWIMTDDHWADFIYKGNKYTIDSPFVDYWIEKPEFAPEEEFKEIIEHLRKYKPIWLLEKISQLDEKRRSKQLKKMQLTRQPKGEIGQSGFERSGETEH